MKCINNDKFKKTSFKGQSGQTAVEYILMIAVIFSVIYPISIKIKSMIIDEECNSSSKSILCNLQTSFPTGQNNYKTFTIIPRN
jgi:hypothetical protein